MHRSRQLLLHLLLVMSAAAQDIPAHLPVSPVLVSRSAIYSQPLVRPNPGWHLRTAVDYSSLVEVSADGTRDLIFDAELLTADLWLTRDLSPRTFLFGNISLRGAYNGALDVPINAYHKLTGLRVPARDRLPENTYDWHVVLPDSSVVFPRPGTFVGDARLGAGWRFDRSQLVVTVTLPTSNAPFEGWGRNTIGTSFAYTRSLKESDRLNVEGGVTYGWTPVHGSLARYQRESFLGMMSALRWRFSGRQALYGTLWVQQGAWKGTGMRSLDGTDVTLDFGALLRLGAHAPELQIGLTEDLYPPGPAIDIGFRLGVRW